MTLRKENGDSKGNTKDWKETSSDMRRAELVKQKLERLDSLTLEDRSDDINKEGCCRFLRYFDDGVCHRGLTDVQILAERLDSYDDGILVNNEITVCFACDLGRYDRFADWKTVAKLN